MAREKIICWTEQDGQMIAVERMENDMVEIRLVDEKSRETVSTATLLAHRWDNIVAALAQ